MPTYNHARFVSEAVESVLSQTYQDWELVVVDDGSTDGTLDIVRRYRDPRIRVIERAHHGLNALGGAYRSALENSSAPLVAILEGDDRWPPDKLARQVPDFDDPDVVLSYGAGWMIDECGCTYGRVTPLAPDVRVNRPIGTIVPSLLPVNPILSPTVVLRRTALETVGGFWQPDGVPYVDHPTWLLLALAGTFAYHDAAVGSWRRHAAQWTTRRVSSDPVIGPESAYVSLIADRYRRAAGKDLPPAQSAETLDRRHRDRAVTNRWRLALLTASRRDVAALAFDLIRSGRARLIGIALLGLAMWAMGSDLEWIQRRRDRVAWPSRRHRHDRPCSGPPIRDQSGTIDTSQGSGSPRPDGQKKKVR
jgi:glycosyltransferase involved in cell wall biosynthesis